MKQKHTPFTKSSSFSAWVDIGRYELFKFLAVLIVIGTDPRPYISDYWSITKHRYTSWFGQMFNRRQFQLLYHSMLHVCQPDAQGKAKIEPFMDKLLEKFQAAFYPYEDLSVDEMVIGFKGRFKHRQYNAAKPKKHHIKTFGLCDSATGYVYNILTYFGANTSYDPEVDPDAQHAVKVFKTLLEPIKKSGHHIFADRYYTSLPLIDELREMRHNYTGTLNVRRRGFPDDLKAMNLRHMETNYYKNEEMNILLVAWKDKKSKKPCVVLSTKGETGSVMRTEGLRAVEKPSIVHAYNMSMNGCDRADQMLSYYSTHNRKTRRWWRKIFHWMWELTQLNAHILHTMGLPANTKKWPYRRFKDVLVEELTSLAASITPERLQHLSIQKGRQPAVNDIERYQGNKHLVQYDGKDMECVLCRKNGKRKRSSYFCTGCSTKPHLCVKECFYAFHTTQ